MSIEKYMEGECHVLAVALHRNMNTAFLLLCERSSDYRDPKTGKSVPAVHHVYASLDNGTLLDIRGEHRAINVKEQWLSLGDDKRINPFTFIEVSDEKSLAQFVDDESWSLPLKSYSDMDVADAWAVFQTSHPELVNPATLTP
jgi:hypothetical protein